MHGAALRSVIIRKRVPGKRRLELCLRYNVDGSEEVANAGPDIATLAKETSPHPVYARQPLILMPLPYHSRGAHTDGA